VNQFSKVVLQLFYRLDGLPRQFNSLTAEQRQQNEHALVRSLAGVESKAPAKRPNADAHSLTHTKFRVPAL